MSKRSRERCKRYCAPGATTCKFHGGASPQAKRAARSRVAESEAIALAEHHEVEPGLDPFDALQTLASRAVEAERILHERVGELRTAKVDSGEVMAWERALTRAGKLLVDISRLDIDERKVAIQQVHLAELGRCWHEAHELLLARLLPLVPTTQRAEAERIVTQEGPGIIRSVFSSRGHNTRALGQ
jgi:hypothetical protein